MIPIPRSVAAGSYGLELGQVWCCEKPFHRVSPTREGLSALMGFKSRDPAVTPWAAGTLPGEGSSLGTSHKPLQPLLVLYPWSQHKPRNEEYEWEPEWQNL